MRSIFFIVMMLIASTGMAAGLGQLLDSFKKPPVTAPQPAPKPPAPPQPVKK